MSFFIPSSHRDPFFPDPLWGCFLLPLLSPILPPVTLLSLIMFLVCDLQTSPSTLSPEYTPKLLSMTFLYNSSPFSPDLIPTDQDPRRLDLSSVPKFVLCIIRLEYFPLLL